MHDREELKRQLDAALGRESEAIIARIDAQERLREFDRRQTAHRLEAEGFFLGSRVVLSFSKWSGPTERHPGVYVICGFKPNGRAILAKVKKDGTTGQPDRAIPYYDRMEKAE